ncbi:MAG: spore coat protein [Bacilli bacterium]|nr:spore coat protein [Bacilli bacterium]
MSDQVLLTNYLILLKGTVEVYIHGTLESSNEDTRKVLKNCLDNTIEMQGNTYLEMADYGYYEINNISENEIKKVVKKLESNK